MDVFVVGIQETEGNLALKRAIKNRYGKFKFHDQDERTAGHRLKTHRHVPVHHDAAFQFNKSEAVFTMGSCFARNVEYFLIEHGFNVLLADWKFPKKWFGAKHEGVEKILSRPGEDHHLRMVLNKYTPASMLNEFRRTLDPDHFEPEDGGLIEVVDGLFWDPQVKNFTAFGIEDALNIRALVASASAAVKFADVVLLTLGYTETWHDTKTGVVLNEAPAAAVVKSMPGRFRFSNATVSEVIDALESIYALITTKVKRDMKFVITVSPVPLGRTFTSVDVIQANAYSKSTLRAAVGEFCANHTNDLVDYFPSYEIVTHSHPDTAWHDDRVHVDHDLVDFVIGRFADAFTKTDQVNLE